MTGISYKKIAQYFWKELSTKDRLRLISVLMVLFLAKVFTAYVPISLKNIINAFQADTSGIYTLIALYFGAFLLGRLLVDVKDYLFIPLEEKFIRKMGDATFRHLHSLSLKFHLDQKVGATARTVERGMHAMGIFFRFMSISIMPIIIEISIIMTILSIGFGVEYVVIILATLTLFIAITLMITKWRVKFLRASVEANSQANATLVESFVNIEPIKAFGHEQYEFEKYNASLARYQSASIKNKNGRVFLNGAQNLIIAIGLLIVMLVACNEILNNILTVGVFVMLISYVVQLSFPLGNLGFAYREVKNALIDMEKMFALLDENVDVKDKPNAPDLTLKGGEIRFEHVSYAYDKRRPILDDISFTAHAGQTVALVGETGSGKSTILKLLLRHDDPQKGKIYIDGQGIDDVTQQSLHHRMGLVPQDTTLFNTSISKNILFGDPQKTQADIAAAAEKAQLHALIQKLPDGYETKVGERGLKLSGGEKQRLALARVFLRNADILLFDESTSALDLKTEQKVWHNIESTYPHTTKVVVAHRLSLIQNADLILVIDNGRLVEKGTHNTLLKANGTYAKLWTKQHSKKKTAATEKAKK